MSVNNTDKIAVLSQNVRELCKREGRNTEQIDICISLLTAEIFSELRADGLDDIYKEVKAIIGDALTTERAVRVCRQLCELAGMATIVNELGVFGENDSADASAEGKIAYVKNKRGDDAYLNFARAVSKARSEYVASIQDACEAVADNRCEYCIVPIENDTDGKLYAFYQLLDRYALKIYRTVRVHSDDGTDGITYALVSGGIKPLRRGNTRQRFEFSVVGIGADFVFDVLSASRELGASVYSAATLPLGYGDRSNRCYFALELLPSDAVVMALYLSLEYNGYTPLGLYDI
jgi:hypothetical protein